LAYGIIFSLSLIGISIISPEVTRGLAKANYWKSFLLKFIPVAIVSTLFLILIKGFLKGQGSLNIFNLVKYMSPAVLITQIFVITQIEELLFGGLFYTSIAGKYGDKSANWITAILFGVFHFAKTGGNIIVMLTYVPLRLIFNHTRNYGIPLLNKIPKIGEKMFGASKQTQQTNAGVHLGWNVFVIGVLKATQI
jgi:membrane protease YdiL (CAAX protease family)